MTYTLCNFDYSDAHYQTLVTLWNQVHPDMMTSVEFQKHLVTSRHVEHPRHAYFILMDGKVVGYGHYTQNPSWAKAKKYFALSVAYPEHDTAVRQFFYTHILSQLATHDLNALVMETREDRTEAIAFYQREGFEQVMRAPVSHLDAQTFASAPFMPQVQRTLDSGIEILSATQLKAEHPDNWGQILHDVRNEIRKDVPSPQPYVPVPYEQYVKYRLQDPRFTTDGVFVARDGDQYVGKTSLHRHAAIAGKFNTRLTGVLRSHRRRGIATALKIYSIEYAKSQNATLIETDNEENNPMYQINLKLGFEPQPAYLEFEKSLR